MAQGVVRPATCVTLAGLALSPAYAYCFVFWLDWRLDGAAIGMSATQVWRESGWVVRGWEALCRAAASTSTTPRACCVLGFAGILSTLINSTGHMRAQITMAVLLGCYIAVRDRGLRGHPTATWHGWGMEALQGWPTYLRWGGWGGQQRSPGVPTRRTVPRRSLFT